MAETFLERLALEPADVAVVGDRIATDVAMGQAIGAAGILVLTGATSTAEVAGDSITPDLVLAGLHELLPNQEPRHE